MSSELPYAPRVLDAELDEILAALPAVALEGAKAVGKTRTTLRRARTVHRLTDPGERAVIEAEPARLVAPQQEPPVLIDEWQRLPASWDLVRDAVDGGARPGTFLLTGSAAPREQPVHSGAGRIVSVRMRPMTLSERRVEQPTVSLERLLTGEMPGIVGETSVRLGDYVDEILASGFPAIRPLPERARRLQLDSYLSRVVDRDFEEVGQTIRNPTVLRRWMTAYAAASSTTASFETIRRAASGGKKGQDSPAKMTGMAYRDALERLWLIEPVLAWRPTRNRIARLSAPPKHQLVDPALAARLLGVDAAALLSGQPLGPPVPRDGTLLGALFESLVTLDLRVYAQQSEAKVEHLRTFSGDHEVDLIVERTDGRVVAVEVRLAHTIDDRDVRHLEWLAAQIGDELLDRVVISTGETAYRRRDGIAVVPAALLGP
jgi:predicted AAA+ superfamily ATPase